MPSSLWANKMWFATISIIKYISLCYNNTYNKKVGVNQEDMENETLFCHSGNTKNLFVEIICYI